METIWDYNPTENELKSLFGNLAAAKRNREQVQDDDDRNMWLASLFGVRGDMEKRDAYVAQIQDKQVRLDMTLLAYEEGEGLF
ncbi:hypothetical protein [Desulfovibrio inopinatus]|uniref:hypothetical protein n=1 Tax=Desulfovibrio inopinatus TaxID=102109 RepID=UPI000421B86F|nr:hypothetical protein [Desulfovibrio inopinatus]